ncbi:sensor histidine kinase [Pengzhenrongella phosphoraccumulans]|uniref:sensor histidine kinase n=1 Tax=Pengzhenrongella phosphoraccumulans TaxID=3114394 RepID=UPI00388FDEB6
MKTRATFADAEGVGVLPWAVGPDGPGRGRLIGNLVLSAAVPVLTLGGVLRGDAPAALAVGMMVVAVVVGAGLFFRTRWPLALLAVSLLGAVAALAIPETGAPMIVASEIAVFTVACVRPRRVAALAALAAAVVLFGVASTDATGPMTEPRMLIVLVWTALAFALGVAVRTQRAYVDALAERSRRAEETREQEARARVAEERVRIARELHDVVAHHIAVINVHAGLARRAVGRDADVVDASLAHVQAAASTVLDELGAVLQVLRSGDSTEAGTEPAPGLDRLDALLATFAATGFAVRTWATGRPRAMDRACDLAAFRIVQESLTNASKHGVGARADLSLTYAADALTIAVTNPIEAEADRPGQGESAAQEHLGHGLIGMRERATASGGSLTAAPDGHGAFRLVAVIPYRPTAPPVAPEPAGQGAVGPPTGGVR